MNAFTTIDLNADVGEGALGEEGLFAAGITSANVACGGHAGDEVAMRLACRRARARGVAVGAHPGYVDRANFGRRQVPLSLGQLRELLESQLASLAEAAKSEGVRLAHLKPHGALYHFLNNDASAARVCVKVARTFGDGPLALYGPPEGALCDEARVAGLCFVGEGFIDRGYRVDGTLIPRGEVGAVLDKENEQVAEAQVLRLARSGSVRTLCVHGDGPDAIRMLSVARAALAASGFSFSAPIR